jgi:hypothetical protein
VEQFLAKLLSGRWRQQVLWSREKARAGIWRQRRGDFRARHLSQQRSPNRVDRYGRPRPFDAGDPTLYRYIVAAEGHAHAADWRINEPQHGYVTPAELLAMTAIDLLYGDAAAAREILHDFQPAMTKDAYLALQRGLFKKERYAGAAA